MKLISSTPVLLLVLAACGGPSSTTVAPAAAPTSANAMPVSSAQTTAASPPAPTATTPAGPLTIADPADPDSKTRLLRIDAPAGATASVTGSSVNVLAGDHFGLGLGEGTEDMHEIAKSFGTPQSSVENAHVEKIKDDVLIYTGTEYGRGGYHFEALVSTKTPPHDYFCGDSGLLKVELTRADVDAMIRACKSITPK